jgi:hypothetical protein
VIPLSTDDVRAEILKHVDWNMIMFEMNQREVFSLDSMRVGALYVKGVHDKFPLTEPYKVRWLAYEDCFLVGIDADEYPSNTLPLLKIKSVEELLDLSLDRKLLTRMLTIKGFMKGGDSNGEKVRQSV